MEETDRAREERQRRGFSRENIDATRTFTQPFTQPFIQSFTRCAVHIPG